MEVLSSHDTDQEDPNLRAQSCGMQTFLNYHVRYRRVSLFTIILHFLSSSQLLSQYLCLYSLEITKLLVRMRKKPIPPTNSAFRVKLNNLCALPFSKRYGWLMADPRFSVVPLACLNKGCMEYQQENFAAALQYFQEALILDSADFRASYYAGMSNGFSTMRSTVITA